MKEIEGTKEQRYYMHLAIKEGTKNLKLKHGGCFGCIIVKGDKVLAVEHNQVIKKKDPTCHGEMMAIRSACKKIRSHDLTGCDLYTSAQPCPMCLSAIYWARVSNIYVGALVEDTAKIGFDDSKIYKVIRGENVGDFEIPMYNLMREEAVSVQKEYDLMEEKELY